MNKIITIGIITLIVVGLGIFLYGCTTQPEPTPKTTPTPEPTPEPEPINQQQVTLANSVVEANNLFATDLYDKYKSEDGNLFFSPYSISSALSMTYEGAKGKTAEEMQAVLHLPDDKNQIRSDFKSIYNDLNKAEKTYKLTTANALWIQEEYPFVDDYFNVVDEYYNGKLANLDFKTDTENSRLVINNWVEDKTNDKIKDLIPAGMLSPATRLVLTNAIYFKANWLNQFDAENTRDGKFKLSSGQDVDTRLMHITSNYNYGETGDLQILEMDYLDKDLSMIIILPKDDKLNKVENDFSKDKLPEFQPFFIPLHLKKLFVDSS